jgi:hypothetical protein
LVNLLDLGPRQPETDTYTDAAGKEYPTDPTALQKIQSIMDLPTKEELDAEAEINLLNAAQDRADAEQAETQVEALPSDTEYFHIDDQLSALATEQDRSDLTDAERMRQAFPELAARYDAEQGNGAFLPSWLRSLGSGVPSYEELKSELPEDAPGGYRVGTRARDIVTAPYDIVGGFLHPDTGPTLGDVVEVGGDFLAGLTGRDIPTEEVVTTDTESEKPVTALLEGMLPQVLIHELERYMRLWEGMQIGML